MRGEDDILRAEQPVVDLGLQLEASRAAPSI